MGQRLDRLNQWWQRTKRQHIPKARAWWAEYNADVQTAMGWALLTLAAFGWRIRAWEASIGLFLFYQVAMSTYATYLSNKIAASRRRIDNG